MTGRKAVRGLKDAARYARERAPWVKPSDEEIEREGGHFGEDGNWVTKRYTRAEASAKANAAVTLETRCASLIKARTKVTLDMRRANIAKATAAVTPETMRKNGLANIAKANAACTPEMRRKSGQKAGLSNRGRLRKGNVSGHVGVHWNAQRHSWYATVTVDGKSVHLGAFKNRKKAVAARKAAELKYWKED